MSNSINNYNNSAYLPPTATDSTNSASTADAQATGEVDAASVLGQVQNLNAVPAYGINAYGGVGQANNAPQPGLGRVTMPVSTLASPDADDLNSMQGRMASFGQGSPSGSTGVVGNSLLYAAESGNLPNLAMFADNGASGVTGGQQPTTPSTFSYGVPVQTRPGSTITYHAMVPASATTSGTSSAPGATGTSTPAGTNASATASTASTASVDGINVISDREMGPSALDSSDMAAALNKNADNHEKGKCKKVENGVKENLKLLKEVGIPDMETRRKLADMLNSNNDKGTTGAARTNLINALSVLGKLNEAGQGKSDAAMQLKSVLHKAGAEVGKDKSYVLSKDFITDSNALASYVGQYALNPSLTKFTEPTVLSGKAQGEAWPVDVSGQFTSSTPSTAPAHTQTTATYTPEVNWGAATPSSASTHSST